MKVKEIKIITPADLKKLGVSGKKKLNSIKC